MATRAVGSDPLPTKPSNCARQPTWSSTSRASTRCGCGGWPHRSGFSAPVRILIDTDPVFTQIRHLSDPLALGQARAHTAFFSFGETIGSTNQDVPDDGIRWRPTRQPIVLDAWPVTPGRRDGSFTTVMQCDSYPTVEHRGRRYGLKSDSFDPCLRLPGNHRSPLEAALGSASASRSELAGHGWTVRDPLEVTRSPWKYQRYIRDSKAEFSIAKHGYVVTRCGWFSERSAAYLASGRPVVVQDTGFGRALPCGSGLFDDLRREPRRSPRGHDSRRGCRSSRSSPRARGRPRRLPAPGRRPMRPLPLGFALLLQLPVGPAGARHSPRAGAPARPPVTPSRSPASISDTTNPAGSASAEQPRSAMSLKAMPSHELHRPALDLVVV